MSINVLFVCLGNICRSPTAHGVFEHLVNQRGLNKIITVDSAGTGDWHIGHSPDSRATATAAGHGYDLSHLRARQVNSTDFELYHYILAMDNNNLSDLQSMRPASFQGNLDLFLSYGNAKEEEVPDPYYGEHDGFEHVLTLVEAASNGLLDHIVKQHQL